jgi:hypothetical protein
MRLRPVFINLVLSGVTLLAIVTAAVYFEPAIPFYGPSFLELRLGWVLIVYFTILAVSSGASIGTKADRKMKSLVRLCRLQLRDNVGESDAGETKSTPYLGEAAPLTPDGRHYERSQFRPYEVLRHMSREARENLIDDARTQTLEMWKSWRPDDHDVLRTTDGIRLEEFEIEILPDDEERLRLKVIPSFSTSEGSSDMDKETYEIVDDFCRSFQDRVIEMTVTHDDFEPSKSK